MRYIFVDEAGTSAHEPISVVVGIVADADRHVRLADFAVVEAIGSVPKDFSNNFIFHATQVFGDKKFQDSGWSLNDRLHLLFSMMSIPRRLGMGIVVSAIWRNATDYTDGLAKTGMSPAQCDHFMAFSDCIMVADRGIRDRTPPNEVASVVAEDVPEMRKFLRIVPDIYKKNPRSLSESMLRQTVGDLEAGFCTQSGDMRVTRVRHAINFVKKTDDPILQVADACAYGLRRYFCKQKFGLEFAKAILGNENHLRNFNSPGGTEGYWPTPKLSFPAYPMPE